MAIPVCLELPDIPNPIEVNLPGGASIASIHADLNRIPSACSTSLNLMAQVGPALAPLKPFFDLLDVAIQLFKCLEAIPDTITSLNPEPLLECIPELAEKVSKVLRLIPQLSIPFTIISIIDNVLALLNCFLGVIDHLIWETEALNRRLAAAAELDDPELDAILECSKNDLSVMTQNGAEALAGVGTLIGVLNIFLSLIGAPEIPIPLPLGEVDVEALEDIIEPVREIMKLLKGIRDAVPVP